MFNKQYKALKNKAMYVENSYILINIRANRRQRKRIFSTSKRFLTPKAGYTKSSTEHLYRQKKESNLRIAL